VVDKGAARPAEQNRSLAAIVSSRVRKGRFLRFGIEHIAPIGHKRADAASAFRTLQDRLPKDHKLTTVEAAKRSIKNTYLAAHNDRFADEGAPSPLAQAQWREVLPPRSSVRLLPRTPSPGNG